MPLTKLNFKPGVNREITSYSNEGGWFDGDKIRFRFGTVEKLGGWAKYAASSFLGICRGILPFVALDKTQYLGVGTNLKYYLVEGGLFEDITPLRITTAAGDVTFAATNGSSTITVTDANHAANINDFVTFSGAVSLGGNITAAVLNQEYQVISVPTPNTYTIQARTVSTIASITVNGQIVPTPVVANGSDTGNGGSSTVGAYQLTTGLDTTVLGTGWGAGTWGRGGWGSAATSPTTGEVLRLWSHDSFGEDLIFNVRDSNIYYWDKSTSSAPLARAVTLDSLSGDATCPTVAKQVMVSDIDRHVIVFGTGTEAAPGTLDPLLIRFSDQANPLIWQSLATNTAGDLRLGSGTEIVTAVKTRQQILIFTDVSLQAMQFVGPPFTFGLQTIAENTTIMGPMSAAAVDDSVFWMGKQDFYVYTGQVQKLPCSVRSYVFNDFNEGQSQKVVASVNSTFSEIWWFYPSASSEELDKYVVFNYLEQVWFYGSLPRTFWIDRGTEEYPIAASTDGYLYNHDFGLDDGSTNPASPISSFIESSSAGIGDGDQFLFIRRMIPDITFDGSSEPNPSVDFTLAVKRFPGSSNSKTTDSPIQQSATVPVEQFTEQAFVRLRGRSFSLKISSDETGTAWRLGTPRVDVRQDGKR